MGTADRHATKGTPEEEAVAELREIAGDRPDLLGQAAGLALGSIGTIGHPPWKRREMDLLIAAGADLAVIPGVAADTAASLHKPFNVDHATPRPPLPPQ